MKKILVATAALAFVFIHLAIAAQQHSGRDIAVLVDDRPNGDDRVMEMTMTLINKSGKSRVRSMVSYSKDYGKDSKSLFVFREPADVRGSAFLTWDYDDVSKDDDKWLYLPALKKEKRISGNSKNDSFMGSDLTYDDMGSRAVDEDTHKLLRDETVDGSECWVLESLPKDSDSIYSKSVSWIRKDALIRVKGEFYDRQGKLLKTMRVSDLRQVDTFWVAMKTEVENVQENHRTVFEISTASFNKRLSDSLFTVAQLKRGVIK